MRTGSIYEGLLAGKLAGRKHIAALIDPDKQKLGQMERTIALAGELGVDYFFIGGSLLLNDALDEVLGRIKREVDIPTILFPGGSRQLSYRADGLLLLSLISGRNADLLIGKHVEVAPFLRRSPLEILSTGYMLIDGGVATSVSYMSNTMPIPRDKADIAVCTAMAGELLGMKLIYMDAGSGARLAVGEGMIRAVSEAVDVPLIVGGGIRTAEQVGKNFGAGADVVVLGNVLEGDPGVLREMVEMRNRCSGR